MRTFATSNHQVLAGLGVATLLVTAAAWLVWLSRHPLHALQELGCDVPALVSWLLVAGLAAHAVVRREWRMGMGMANGVSHRTPDARA